MKKILILLTLCLLLLYGCGKEPEPDTRNFSPKAETVEISLPAASREYKLLWLSDLHMVLPGKEGDPAQQDAIDARTAYSTSGGIPAAEQWELWIPYLTDAKADALLFGGDMLDLCSTEGVDTLSEGFAKLESPYIYLRADHDLLPTYLKDYDVQGAWDKQSSLCKNEGVMSMAFDDFTLIAWNNSTSELTDSGLERILQLVDEGKPLVLLTHVPIAPLEDESLAEASRAAFDGRVLLWGYGDCEYVPGPNTRQLLDLLYAEDSPFIAVFAGHLHFSWDGYINKNVPEHVFGPAFAGDHGIITLK